MSFENWAAGEPNDANGGENALQIYASGKWNDLPAINTTLSGYVIEFGSDDSRSSTRKRVQALAAFVETSAQGLQSGPPLCRTNHAGGPR